MREPSKAPDERVASGADAPTNGRFVLMLVMTILGVGIGYALAVTFRAPPPARETPATPSGVVGEPMHRAADEIASLRRELDAERSERQRLEAELLQWKSAPAGGVATIEPQPPADDRPDPPAENIPGGRRPGEAVVWFDRDALELAGLPPSEVDEVQERFERFEMEKLYLVDEAKREGTFRSGPYNRAVAQMTRDLRDDLGPAGYDAYLYATGKENRIVIKEVLNDSPAGRGGVEEGDLVIRYAGDRIFHAGEFQAATSAGTLGESVGLDVERDGVIHRLSVERGPLGIRLGRARVPPLTR